MTPSTLKRAVYAIGFILICLVLYLVAADGDEGSSPITNTDAEARQARWLASMAPLFNMRRSAQSYNTPLKPAQLQRAKPLVPFSPFPLGAPASSSTRRKPSRSANTDFVELSFDFQEELFDINIPRTSLLRQKNRTPHNFVPGQPRPTFATFLSTRNASVQDPYFVAAQSLVYRLLWDPDTASKEYPVTVFVAPFVTQEQRDMLSGAGAVVRELELLDWKPNVGGVNARLRDQFAKLNMWAFTEFSLIAFMDSDALPISNIDEIFYTVERQNCIAKKLNSHDKVMAEQICEYAFAGVENIGGKGKIHGGFLVFEPNKAMHKKLLREYPRTDQYDNANAEQGFLNWQFSQKGAFPAQIIPRKFNGFFPQEADEFKLSVIHEKLWSPDVPVPLWLEGAWEYSWKQMLAFYNGPAFSHARKLDPMLEADPGPRTQKQQPVAAAGVGAGESKQAASRQFPNDDVEAGARGMQRKRVEQTPDGPAAAAQRPRRNAAGLSEKQQRMLDRQQLNRGPSLDDF